MRSASPWTAELCGCAGQESLVFQSTSGLFRKMGFKPWAFHHRNRLQLVAVQLRRSHQRRSPKREVRVLRLPMLWHVPDRTNRSPRSCGVSVFVLRWPGGGRRPEADVAADPGCLSLGLPSLPCRVAQADSRCPGSGACTEHTWSTIGPWERQCHPSIYLYNLFLLYIFL